MNVIVENFKVNLIEDGKYRLCNKKILRSGRGCASRIKNTGKAIFRISNGYFR